MIAGKLSIYGKIGYALSQNGALKILHPDAALAVSPLA
jgi:hypothetical protein